MKRTAVWTSMRCASSVRASPSCTGPDNATIVITHYQRLLDYIVPDFVHVLYKGRIIYSGDRSLALKLEKEGYDWLINDYKE